MSVAGSSAAEPLLLIGARRRAALHDTLVACVQAWRKDWSGAADPVRVLLAEEVEHTCVRSAHATCISMKSAAHGGLAWLHAEHDALTGWLGIAAPRSTARPARTSSHESSRPRCYVRSARPWHGARASTIRLSKRRRVPQRPDRRARALAVTIQMGSSRAKTTLLLTSRFVELLVPPRSAERASSAVARRRPAIAEERVSMEAVLGDAEVSLRDLAQLALGDVIVLDRTLRAGGRLTMPDGTASHPSPIGRMRRPPRGQHQQAHLEVEGRHHGVAMS